MDGSPPSRRTFARRWRLLSSVLLLGASGACRFVAREPLSPSLQARARLLRIEDTRRDEPALIDSLIASRDVATRAAAALTIGRIGARRHLGGLRRLAADADSTVSATALFSLGLLKDTASALLAVSSLHAGYGPANEAAWLLGELGDAGRAAIVSGLADATLSPTTRAALLLASTRLRPVPAAAITPLLASRDSAIAWLGQNWNSVGLGCLALVGLVLLRSMLKSLPASVPPCQSRPGVVGATRALLNRASCW